MNGRLRFYKVVAGGWSTLEINLYIKLLSPTCMVLNLLHLFNSKRSRRILLACIGHRLNQANVDWQSPSTSYNMINWIHSSTKTYSGIPYDHLLCHFDRALYNFLFQAHAFTTKLKYGQQRKRIHERRTN